MYVKILLVEDEERLGKSIKKALEKQGYTVYYFITAEQAELFLFKNHDGIDLILLDSMLPGKSGVDFCKTLRNHELSMPILMLTAKDASSDVIISLDAGVDDYLIKPFSLDILFARVRALLRRSQKIEKITSELHLGKLVLNIGTRKLFYNGKEITLTLKEFNLLQYLMEHPNIALERETMLEKIWDINFDSFSNVVDVHIKNIRKKLKEAHAEIILETVRGVGYRIQE